MTDLDLIAKLQGPKTVKDFMTAIHIDARDARRAAERLAVMLDALRRIDTVTTLGEAQKIARDATK